MTSVMESPKTQSITIADQKNTKIVATVGPACNQYSQLLELAKAGVNVFRLNFSHGEHATHLSVIQNICAINEKYGLHIGILADLQGPKLRVDCITGRLSGTRVIRAAMLDTLRA